MTIVRLPAADSAWDALRIDRVSAIPIYVQLKAQLEYVIATGRAASGTRLPSVRVLAARLGVASDTVRQAYEELERQGLVATRQGAGSFASVPPSAGTGVSWDASVLAGVDTFLEETLARGVPGSAVLRAVRHRFALLERGPAVSFVGVRPSTERYAAGISATLPKSTGPVHPVAIEDLRAHPETVDELLGAATHVVSLTFHHKELETVLAERPVRALPVVAELGAKVVRGIDRLPASARPLLVCRVASRPIYEELIRLHRPAGSKLLFARDDRPADIARASKDATVVLHSTVAATAVAQSVHKSLPRLELLHVPNAASLQRVANTIRADWEQALRLQHAAVPPPNG